MPSSAIQQAYIDRVWFSPTTTVPKMKLKSVKGKFVSPSRLVRVVHHDPTSVIIVVYGYALPAPNRGLIHNAGSNMVLGIDQYLSVTTKSTSVSAQTVLRKKLHEREAGKNSGWVSPLQPLDWLSVLAEES